VLQAGRIVWQRIHWWRLAALLCAASLAAWLVTPSRIMSGAITLRNAEGVEVHILRCACARLWPIGRAQWLHPAPPW